MSLKLIKIEPIKDQIITTANRYAPDVFDKNGIMHIQSFKEALGDYKEYQVIEQLGPDVIEKYPYLHVGDTVMIDPTAYTYKRGRKNSVAEDDPEVHISYDDVTYWPILKFGETGNEEHMVIHQRDIMFKITEYRD